MGRVFTALLFACQLNLPQGLLSKLYSGYFFGNEIWFYHYVKIFFQSLSFCASSRAAFQLVMRNLLRVVVLDSVTDLLLLIGKLVVVLLCGSTSYLAFHGHIPEVKLRQNRFDVKIVQVVGTGSSFEIVPKFPDMA